ncbi:midnolin homolog [Pararge aegeria]|uniref:Jg24077 protein n=4 Tax=Pararge aegeria TaxID=116150 RepID=A0A8S4RFW9_9NEOP|nr:midnolin homolog [Pararge aegeria]CAH2236182.1 jg24077 [Pararge aegeria aegeria]
MERATGTEVYGCGSPHSTDITLNIQTTTGGNFSISLNGKNTVEHLKKLVSKKLKVSKDRICLLHRERQLRDGTLEENGLLDGSRIILLPSVETGLLSQRPENSVMQALESLNDTQVNDFLSGKSPLNLTMRLGDHMMLIQLQLSTLNTTASSIAQHLRNTQAKNAARTKCESKDTPSPQVTPQKSTQSENSVPRSEKSKQEAQKSVLQQQDIDMLQNALGLYQKMTEEQFQSSSSDDKEEMDTTNCTLIDLTETSLENEQSPIKSLSNLVSSPINVSTSEGREATLGTSVKNSLIDLLSSNKSATLATDAVPSTSAMADKACPTTSHTPDSSISDDSDNFSDQSSFLAESTIDEYPMENLFNNAVDKGLFDDQDESMMDREISNLATTSHGTQESSAGPLPSFQSLNEPLKSKRFQYMLHKTSKFKHPIGLNKQKTFIQSVVNKQKKKTSNQTETSPQPSTSRTEPYVTSAKKPVQVIDASADNSTPSTSKQVTFKAPDAPKKPQRVSQTPPVDTKALIEASKNLTQKLKKLSKEVLTNKIDLRTPEETDRAKLGPGAVIETMKHHGKGIYSGTFSGTLNPALQDRFGRPKRDISTIIHILNDLLCAAPPIAISTKEPNFCTANGIEDHSKCLGCNVLPCPDGHCQGHLQSVPDKCTCTRKNCHCIRLNPNICIFCDRRPDLLAGRICKSCDSAKSLELENTKTKCKLEQLRLVMQQKKQRREARKLKTLPYTTPQSISPPKKASVVNEEIDTVG